MAKHQALIDTIRAQFALDWTGVHGSPHWARVLAIGTQVAESTDADVEVLKYFALLHDSRRLNDGGDPDHGPRAARWAEAAAGCLVSEWRTRSRS